MSEQGMAEQVEKIRRASGDCCPACGSSSRCGQRTSTSVFRRTSVFCTDCGKEYVLDAPAAEEKPPQPTADKDAVIEQLRQLVGWLLAEYCQLAHDLHDSRLLAAGLQVDVERLREERAALALERRVSDSEMGALLKRTNKEFWERAEAAEDALRSLASYVSAGGHNADAVDAAAFEKKIREGIDLTILPLVKRIEEQAAKAERLRAAVAEEREACAAIAESAPEALQDKQSARDSSNKEDA
jgi:FtsZ-binding cell division protein ZapB